MYAVIKTGGKQYRVSEGDKLHVEKLAGDAGDEISFDEVLLVGGDSPKVGTPMVAGASVKAKTSRPSSAPSARSWRACDRRRRRRDTAPFDGAQCDRESDAPRWFALRRACRFW